MYPGLKEQKERSEIDGVWPMQNGGPTGDGQGIKHLSHGKGCLRNRLACRRVNRVLLTYLLTRAWTRVWMAVGVSECRAVRFW